MSEDRSVLDRVGPEPDEVLAYGNDASQVIDVWHGDGPVVVLLHGGFWRPQWDRTHLRPLAGAFRDEGFAVALVEYRRVPGEPDLTTADVRAAMERLSGPMILVGHSAGGHLALWAAVQSETAAQSGADAGAGIAAVVALAPVADLVMAEELDLDGGAVRDFLGGAASERQDLDPKRLRASGVEVVVLHGTRDGRVPFEVSASYAQAHPEARIVRLEDADHFALIDPESKAWPVLLGEVRRW